MTGVAFRPVAARGLRPNHLYRSGDPLAFSRADAEQLAQVFGIETLIDLRSTGEVSRKGRPEAVVSAGIRWVDSPLSGYSHGPVDCARPTPPDFASYYLGILVGAEPGCLPRFFRTVAEVGSAPFLVACHCGKDRTGVAVSLLLSALGAPEGDICRDYAAGAPDLVAQVDRFREKWEKRNHTRDDYLVRMRTKPESMSLFLRSVRGRFGTVAAGLAHAGVEPSDVERCRALLADGWKAAGMPDSTVAHG